MRTQLLSDSSEIKSEKAAPSTLSKWIKVQHPQRIHAMLDFSFMYQKLLSLVDAVFDQIRPDLNHNCIHCAELCS